MPKGPQGQPLAMSSRTPSKVMRIATGEEEYEDDGKDPAAKALGAKGGRARVERLTPERRREIGRKAAAKRWTKSKSE